MYIFYFALIIVVVCFCLKHIHRRKKISEQLPCLKYRFYEILGDVKNVNAHRRLTGKTEATSAYVYEFLEGYCRLFEKKPLCCIWLSYIPFVIISKAEVVQELISGTKLMQKSFFYDYLHPWLGLGLLTSSGNKWKSRRKLLTPAFHFDVLKDFLPIFNEKSDILIQRIRQEADRPWIDIVRHSILCSLDIICETTMGVNVHAQENVDSEYAKSVQRVAEAFVKRTIFIKYWLNFTFYLTKLGRQFKKDVKLLHDFTKQVIREKKAKFLKEGLNTQTKRKALMDLLIEQHVQNQSLSEEDIQEEVDTFTFEGHDTTAMGISWALYLIGLHQEVQAKLNDELESIFGDNRESVITNDDLGRMKYLECVLKETQRLYPSVPVIGRKIDQDINACGYRIPKGSVALFVIYQLHRNKDVFPNPEKFDPDRFLPENCLNRHPFAYIPFSAGPRNCIGQRFALMEEKVVVASILRNFHLESLTPRDQIHPCVEMILRPTEPLKIKFTPKT